MLKTFTIAFLLFITNNFTLLSAKQAFAQTPPAETYQPGYWQPVARADINRPINLQLINKTGLVVAYSITESQMEPIMIPANQTMTLNNVKLNLYAVIYPDSQNPDDSLIDLQYEVQVTVENTVEIVIKRTENSSISHRSFNLQESGAIYVY